MSGASGWTALLLHPDVLPGPGTVWQAWNGNLWIIIGLWLPSFLYLRGVRELWHSAGRGNGVPRWRVASFLAGIGTLFVALISPLDALGAALFSAHMIQHLLLMLVAAPLLALGSPLVPMLWALPVTWRVTLGRSWKRTGGRATWRILSHPLSVWLLYAGGLWLWHMPIPYQAALGSELLHAAEHLTFLGTAMLFWWILLHAGTRGARTYGVGVLFVFATAVQSGALGAMITFASAPWYPAHAGGASLWGVGLLEDQQLAGLLMWVPPGAFYVVVALLIFGAWLRAVERRVQRSERLRGAVADRGAEAVERARGGR